MLSGQGASDAPHCHRFRLDLVRRHAGDRSGLVWDWPAVSANPAFAAVLTATASVCPLTRSFPDHHRGGAVSPASRRLRHIRIFKHQSDARFLPCCIRNCGAGFTPARPRIFIRQTPGSNRPFDIAARDKKSFQDRCHRAIPHFNQALSSPVCLAGFQTSEASNGRVPKSPRPFHKNAGELPNVGG